MTGRIRRHAEQLRGALSRRTAWMLGILLLTATGGCAGSSSHIVRPGYEKEMGPSVAIGAFLLIANPDSGATASPAHPRAGGSTSGETLNVTQRGRKVLRQFHRQILGDVLDAEVLDITLSGQPGDFPLVYQPLSFQEKGSMVFPTPSKPFQFRRADPQFLLFLSDLFFTVLTKKEQGPHIVSTKTTYDYALHGECTYVLWDNRAGEIAAYGKTQQTRSSSAVPDSRNYLDVFWDIAGEIADETPLARSANRMR